MDHIEDACQQMAWTLMGDLNEPSHDAEQKKEGKLPK